MIMPKFRLASVTKCDILDGLVLVLARLSLMARSEFQGATVL